MADGEFLDPITKGKIEKRLRRNIERAGGSLARRRISRGGFIVEGSEYFSRSLIKYEGKIFAILEFDQTGSAVGIVERGGSLHRHVVPKTDGAATDVFGREMNRYFYVVEQGGIVIFLGRLFAGKGLEQHKGEVVTILPADGDLDIHLAEFDGIFYELEELIGESVEQYLNGKAIQIATELCGMSVAQAEFVLKEAGAILNEQISLD